MLNKLNTICQSLVQRHHLKVVAFAAAGIVIGGGVVWYAMHAAVSDDASQADLSLLQIESSEKGTSTLSSVLPAAEPIRIRIPQINVNADFEQPLGVDSNREIEVPEAYETVGWYKYGPTPGELGPAVVLGHVDSYEGPAVFYNLRQLTEGDEVFVDREDGTTATFTVERLERHDQSDFPTQKVYGNLDYPGLRLITCTGTYDRGVQRYSHNLIVFARLKEE